MSTVSYPHSTIDPDGTVRIGQTRYKVLHLAGEHYHHGWSAEELLRQHPDLRPEEVYAALTYFYDHYNEIVAQLDAAAEAGEQLRAPSNLSRAELLRRKKDAK
jgi:uncharacterized protein (DUF433 family)